MLAITYTLHKPVREYTALHARLHALGAVQAVDTWYLRGRTDAKAIADLLHQTVDSNDEIMVWDGINRPVGWLLPATWDKVDQVYPPLLQLRASPQLRLSR
jgi:hypothetical protein